MSQFPPLPPLNTENDDLIREYVRDAYHVAGRIIGAVMEGLALELAGVVGRIVNYAPHVCSRLHCPDIADGHFTSVTSGAVAELMHLFGHDRIRCRPRSYTELELFRGTFGQAARLAERLSPNGSLTLVDWRATLVFDALAQPANWIRVENLALALFKNSLLTGQQISAVLEPSFSVCDGLQLNHELN